MTSLISEYYEKLFGVAPEPGHIYVAVSILVLIVLLLNHLFNRSTRHVKLRIKKTAKSSPGSGKKPSPNKPSPNKPSPNKEKATPGKGSPPKKVKKESPGKTAKQAAAKAPSSRESAPTRTASNVIFQAQAPSDEGEWITVSKKKPVTRTTKTTKRN